MTDVASAERIILSRILTRAEVSDLTDCRQKAGQIDALRLMGIAFHVPPSGWPKVTWAAVEGRNEPAATKTTWTPRLIGNHGKTA